MAPHFVLDTETTGYGTAPSCYDATEENCRAIPWHRESCRVPETEQPELRPQSKAMRPCPLIPEVLYPKDLGSPCTYGTDAKHSLGRSARVSTMLGFLGQKRHRFIGPGVGAACSMAGVSRTFWRRYLWYRDGLRHSCRGRFPSAISQPHWHHIMQFPARQAVPAQRLGRSLGRYTLPLGLVSISVDGLRTCPRRSCNLKIPCMRPFAREIPTHPGRVAALTLR